MKDIPIAKMLDSMGVSHPASQRAARAALVDARVVSRPDRANIAIHKEDRVRRVLTDVFLWRCSDGDCRRQADARRERPLLVEKDHCQLCRGSSDGFALSKLAVAMSDAGLRRVLVVGGTKEKWRAIEGHSPAGLEWRFVDGRQARPARRYRADRDWADVIVLWGSTPLAHSVSDHFAGSPKVRTVKRRGISAMVSEIVRHLGEGSGGARPQGHWLPSSAPTRC